MTEWFSPFLTHEDLLLSPDYRNVAYLQQSAAVQVRERQWEIYIKQEIPVPQKT